MYRARIFKYLWHFLILILYIITLYTHSFEYPTDKLFIQTVSNVHLGSLPISLSETMIGRAYLYVVYSISRRVKPAAITPMCAIFVYDIYCSQHNITLYTGQPQMVDLLYCDQNWFFFFQFAARWIFINSFVYNTRVCRYRWSCSFKNK